VLILLVCYIPIHRSGNWSILPIFTAAKKVLMKTFTIPGSFSLECGDVLEQVEIAYLTLGEMNQQGDNVIWICHALTANADPEEWWPGMVGHGKLFDPGQYFIVCANILGSCYGSTFAGSMKPGSNTAYGREFPLITVRDQVTAMMALKNHLGIKHIRLCVGASLGGMQVMEWAVMEPSQFAKICLIATNARHSPWGIAFNEAQRMAIYADSTLYDDTPEAGWKGLAAARAIAMLSYRNYRTYGLTQLDNLNKYDQFKAASYQQYQGEKLCKRFHPWAYLTLSRMMDSHNIGRNRESVEAALQMIFTPTLVIGIESDFLFPLSEQQDLARKIPGAFLKVVNSRYGHDGFLIENEILTDIIGEFLVED